MQPIEVLIAIQARSNSTRFPKKIFEYIGEKRVLDHVIDCAMSTAQHIGKFTTKLEIKCQVAVLHPADDHELIQTFGHSGAIMISGDEQDVLSRYVKAQAMTDADYVVRLTSDCPLMLDYVVAKHIHVACFNKHDYVSNVDEACRSAADGFDVEVISRKAMKWLDANATTAFDREHVTTAIRRERPAGLSQALVSFKLDTSHMKMSVDTPDELTVARKYFHDREAKSTTAQRKFGKKNVYEL